jgi:hypothetical protein
MAPEVGHMVYTLKHATMVLALKDNHEAAIPIPAGRVVDVATSAEDDRFVVLSVDGEQFLAFASDLIEGAPPMRTAGA